MLIWVKYEKVYFHLLLLTFVNSHAKYCLHLKTKILNLTLVSYSVSISVKINLKVFKLKLFSSNFYFCFNSLLKSAALSFTGLQEIDTSQINLEKDDWSGVRHESQSRVKGHWYHDQKDENKGNNFSEYSVTGLSFIQTHLYSTSSYFRVKKNIFITLHVILMIYLNFFS